MADGSSYLNDLERRVGSLEESLTAVKNDLQGLTSRVDLEWNPLERVNKYTPESNPMPNLAGTEDSVDAMGAVVFADEEHCGFFGNFPFLSSFEFFSVVQHG